MNDRDPFEVLKINYSGDEPREMHRPGQRVVRFKIVFDVLPLPPEARDYRLCLDRLWAPFLAESGLSAGICHMACNAERILYPSVLGHVWRQYGVERWGSVTEPELLSLCDLLRTTDARPVQFTIDEQFTTELFGKNQTRRKFCFLNGEFSIETVSA